MKKEENGKTQTVHQHPTIEELQRALQDSQLRDEIRHRYGVEVQSTDTACDVPFEDHPAWRKEAIFNSW
jgi:hypothetical protein